jgi:hypothetical protein
MTSRLGIHLGDARTTWTLATDRPGGASRTGSLPTVVGVTTDGTVLVGDDVTTTPPGVLVQSTQGFVSRLGESDPVVLGGTPYGPEALVA